jgi:ubiquitin-like protein Nedd8
MDEEEGARGRLRDGDEDDQGDYYDSHDDDEDDDNDDNDEEEAAAFVGGRSEREALRVMAKRMRLMQPFADRHHQRGDGDGDNVEAMAAADDADADADHRRPRRASALTRTRANPNRASLHDGGGGKGKEWVTDHDHDHDNDNDELDVDDDGVDDEEELYVRVKTLTGKVLQVAGLRRGTTVAEVKQRLEETAGIPSHQQRLVYRGKQMADARTLAHYAVGPNAILYMVLALRG